MNKEMNKEQKFKKWFEDTEKSNKIKNYQLVQLLLICLEMKVLLLR